MPKLFERILPTSAITCTTLTAIQTVYLNYMAFANSKSIRENQWQMTLFSCSQLGRLFFTFLLYHLFNTKAVTRKTGQWLDKKIACQPVATDDAMTSFYFTSKRITGLSFTLWTLQLAQLYSNLTTSNSQTHAIDDMSTANVLPESVFWPIYYVITFGAQPIMGILTTQIITRKIIGDIHDASENYQGKTRAALPFAIFGLFCNLVDIASSVFNTWASNASQCEGFKHPSTLTSLAITAINNSIIFFAIGQIHTWMQRGDMLANSFCCKKKTTPTMLEETLLGDDAPPGATAPNIIAPPAASSRRYQILGGLVLVALIINFVIAEITEYRTYGKLWEEAIDKGCPLKINLHLYRAAVISAMIAGLINGGSEVHTIIIGGLRTLKKKYAFFQPQNATAIDADNSRQAELHTAGIIA
ncbi:MAG: hypothetical protein P1U40_04815 [Coxiellaceae bacterium]|nr:hypothetical protein [Coxiellaceae bacterium]